MGYKHDKRKPERTSGDSICSSHSSRNDCHCEVARRMSIDILKYRPQIEAALEYGGGTHTFEDVVQMLVENRAQAWVNGSSIAITEIVYFPRKRALHCFLAGGEMREIIEMMPSAAQFGADHGCTDFTIAGRKGWQRVLRRYGWSPRMTVMGWDISQIKPLCYNADEAKEAGQ